MRCQFDLKRIGVSPEVIRCIVNGVIHQIVRGIVIV